MNSYAFVRESYQKSENCQTKFYQSAQTVQPILVMMVCDTSKHLLLLLEKYPCLR